MFNKKYIFLWEAHKYVICLLPSYPPTKGMLFSSGKHAEKSLVIKQRPFD